MYKDMDGDKIKQVWIAIRQISSENYEKYTVNNINISELGQAIWDGGRHLYSPLSGDFKGKEVYTLSNI